MGAEDRRTYAVLGSLVPKGHQKLTVGATAESLTIPQGARIALIKTTVQNVRWTDDGTAPTAILGIQMITTDEPFWYNGDLSAIQFFREAGGAILDILYYG